MFKVLKLHEMETSSCGLSCTDCYLKNSNQSNDKLDYHLQQLAPECKVYAALYLNYLKRDVNEALKESKLLLSLGNKIQKRILVIDSLSAKQLRINALHQNQIREIGISIKNSTLDFTIDKFEDIEVNLIYTVGIDPIEYISQAIRAGITNIELNIRKPASSKDMVNYISLQNQLSEYKELTIIGDPCVIYVGENKVCSDVSGDTLEITTFLNSKSAYTCMYPTDTCIM